MTTKNHEGNAHNLSAVSITALGAHSLQANAGTTGRSRSIFSYTPEKVASVFVGFEYVGDDFGNFGWHWHASAAVVQRQNGGVIPHDATERAELARLCKEALAGAGTPGAWDENVTKKAVHLWVKARPDEVALMPRASLSAWSAAEQGSPPKLARPPAAPLAPIIELPVAPRLPALMRDPTFMRGFEAGKMNEAMKEERLEVRGYFLDPDLETLRVIAHVHEYELVEVGEPELQHGPDGPPSRLLRFLPKALIHNS